MSFSHAAEELSVTPGAVSRQIKQLEGALGAPLFERRNREVRLTEDGRAYLEATTDALSRIDGATRRMLERGRHKPLHIWSSMTFSMRWLVPRLPAYHAANPGLDVLLTTSLQPVDFSTGDVDVAIRLGMGSWPGVRAHFLMRPELTPVCAPELLRDGPALERIDDLTQHTLLHSTVRGSDWEDWLRASGASDVDASRGIKFQSSSLAYQAALRGMGVAMGQRALVAEELATGRLVAPLDFTLPGKEAFYLLYPEAAEHQPELVAFRDWLLSEVHTLDPIASGT